MESTITFNYADAYVRQAFADKAIESQNYVEADEAFMETDAYRGMLTHININKHLHDVVRNGEVKQCL